MGHLSLQAEHGRVRRRPPPAARATTGPRRCPREPAGRCAALADRTVKPVHLLHPGRRKPLIPLHLQRARNRLVTRRCARSAGVDCEGTAELARSATAPDCERAAGSLGTSVLRPGLNSSAAARDDVDGARRPRGDAAAKEDAWTGRGRGYDEEEAQVILCGVCRSCDDVGKGPVVHARVPLAKCDGPG